MQAIDRITQYRSLNPARLYLLAAGAILLLAAGLRLWGLGAESAWIDEAYSIALAKHSIPQIIIGTAADQHPPLYYLLLHFWLLFGSSVAYARLLSAIIGIIGVGQIIILGRKFGGWYLGLTAGLLLAISPMHIWFSKEVRMYILLAALTTASTYELWKCLHGKGRWWLYTIYSILALYTQYFAVFIFMAQAVWVLAWTLWQKDKRAITFWAISMVATIIAFLPWLPTAINQTRFHTMPWIQPPQIQDFRDTILRLILGNAVLGLPSLGRWLTLIAALCLLVWVTIRVFHTENKIRQAVSYSAIWGFLPLILVFGVALKYPIFQYKQFLIILLPVLLSCAWSVWVLPNGIGRTILAGVLIVSLLSTMYQQIHLSKDNWRGAAEYIRNHQTAGDIIFENPAASSLALNLYGTGNVSSSGWPENYDILTGGWNGYQLTTGRTNQIFPTLTNGRKRLWLVEFEPEFWDPNKTVESWLIQNGSLLTDQSFGHIRVRLFQLMTTP